MPADAAMSDPSPATASADVLGTPLLAGVQIAGWGTALPTRRVTNLDLAEYLDTSDEWIVERSGIRERRWAGPGETTGTLGLAAARDALADAGVDPADVDV
ncbi:MAG: hypothetical protein PV358_13735, partial [Acidimicrobiales bacterium]|nr:hypothetical protein [Acidimicrobiales bacterium]